MKYLKGKSLKVVERGSYICIKCTYITHCTITFTSTHNKYKIKRSSHFDDLYDMNKEKAII